MTSMTAKPKVKHIDKCVGIPIEPLTHDIQPRNTRIAVPIISARNFEILSNVAVFMPTKNIKKKKTKKNELIK